MMTIPRPHKNEQPSTYFVQDRQNKEELIRLTIQDQMLTAAMGGVLPEQEDASVFHSVLDVGCGSGSWLIETAQRYPGMSLVGIDISQRMIDYCRKQAEAEHVSDRIEFLVMDALRPLEFADATFDLVNLRLGLSYVRTWDWPKLLEEFYRIVKPGGVVRLTEADMIDSTSPALTQREALLLQAFHEAGHFFVKSNNGVTSELTSLLQRHGFRQVQTRVHTLLFSSGTPEGENFAENIQHGFRTLRPFMQKWGRVPETYEEIYRNALSEMQQPDFRATWSFLTAWGYKG